MESSPLNFFMVEDEAERELAAADATTNKSKILVTFDFTGAMPITHEKPRRHTPFCISITEDNLVTLRSLVQRTGLIDRSPAEVCRILLRNASRHIACRGSSGHVSNPALHRGDFGRCIRELVPSAASRNFTQSEMEDFSLCFMSFFDCYVRNDYGSTTTTAATNTHNTERDLVDAKELAVGFSALCAGSKSAKLSIGFDFFDEPQRGYLTKDSLMTYIRSFLTMLVGISYLSSAPEGPRTLSPAERNEMAGAIDNGAHWTMRHFLKTHARQGGSDKEITFEHFARWYTDGGYSIAPWLELLDLNKLLKLLTEEESTKASSSRYGSFHPVTAPPPVPPASAGQPFRTPGSVNSRRRRTPGGVPMLPEREILFTFPLAKRRSLVVLREDATYVRTVVENLGLVNSAPDEIWKKLYTIAKKRPLPPSQPWSRSRQRKNCKGKSRDMDQNTFVDAMEDMLKSKCKVQLSPSGRETLQNFFQSFDLEQVDRVALNQLMGGLSLLCGGKKSTKLAFSFGLFDARRDGKDGLVPNPSLNVEDLFIFLRSILIVMFSCCSQSLDLSAEAVSRYISDTAHMVAEDVMRYQWHSRKRDRVDFDEFGEWYNEGGFETAPWLELLDLKKWVLVDDLDKLEQHSVPAPTMDLGNGNHRAAASSSSTIPSGMQSSSDPAPSLPPPPPPPPAAAAAPGVGSHNNNDNGNTSDGNNNNSNPSTDFQHFCPPPPPEDEVDPSFFGDDANAIMAMDSIDEMDLIFLEPSQDKENDTSFGSNKLFDTVVASPRQQSQHHQHHHSSHSHGHHHSSHSEQSQQAPTKPKPGHSLRFHLVTSHKHGGYKLCVTPTRVRHLRHVLTQSGLCRIGVESACDIILKKASPLKGAPKRRKYVLDRDDFDSAIRDILARVGPGGGSGMSVDTQRVFSEVMASIFAAFDHSGTGKVDAGELASGFTVLCSGKKSDKLEHGFEVLDNNKKGQLPRSEVKVYIRSFLTVLLSVACSKHLESDTDEQGMSFVDGSPCSQDLPELGKAAEAGSEWAASQALASVTAKTMNFDDFAEWYTKKGYSSIPWLELLDLRKWVLNG